MNAATWIRRNAYGAVVLDIVDDETIGVTQVFETGEIWGMEKWLLRNTDHDGVPYIPSERLETHLEEALDQYLHFAKDALHLELPLRFIAGLSGIEGYKMAMDHGCFTDVVFKDEVLFEGTVTSFEEAVKDILRPLYASVWDACGRSYPLNNEA